MSVVVCVLGGGRRRRRRQWGRGASTARTEHRAWVGDAPCMSRLCRMSGISGYGTKNFLIAMPCHGSATCQPQGATGAAPRGNSGGTARKQQGCKPRYSVYAACETAAQEWESTRTCS